MIMMGNIDQLVIYLVQCIMWCIYQMFCFTYGLKVKMVDGDVQVVKMSLKGSQMFTNAFVV